jgi:dTDP-4-amino-4,6-dideoxygalactose transaminase
VFVDIRPDTLNIDESLIEAAITERTRALVVVHYAGVGCAMDEIVGIGRRHGIPIIEDAAQAIQSTYDGKALGTFGELGTLSFHETKNVISGEGGALLVNAAPLVERAEIVREKGTDRSRFFRGQVDKYTWCDIGSSYLPGEVTAAFLWGQLQHAGEIRERRMQLWERYHAAFRDLEERGLLRRPVVPGRCRHNAHMYYLLLPSLGRRTEFIAHLRGRGIQAVFHYVPLHSSPAGMRYGRACGPLATTDDLANRLVRLPMWVGMESVQDEVVDAVRDFLDR